tara:strand:+ start:107 stop:286 length:180 start_codon:yes stop_codon:yes gene_type:complete
VALIKHIYRENGIRKAVKFSYKSSRKGIDYSQLDPYYEWRNKNKHTDWLGLSINNEDIK